MERISEQEIRDKFLTLVGDKLGELKLLNYSIDIVEFDPNSNNDIFMVRNSNYRVNLLLSFNDEPFVIMFREYITKYDRTNIENIIYRDIIESTSNMIRSKALDHNTIIKVIKKKYDKKILEICNFISDKIELLSVIK